jgi:hypothetical protein
MESITNSSPKNLLSPLVKSALIFVASICLAACSANNVVTTSTVNPANKLSEIYTDFATLFNFSNGNINQKVAVVQDGDQLKAAMQKGFSSSLAKMAGGAKVSNVVLDSNEACKNAAQPYPCAQVTYYILGTNGTPILGSASTGYAVFINNKWLISKSVICGLLGLLYSSGLPAICE